MHCKLIYNAKGTGGQSAVSRCTGAAVGQKNFETGSLRSRLLRIVPMFAATAVSYGVISSEALSALEIKRSVVEDMMVQRFRARLHSMSDQELAQATEHMLEEMESSGFPTDLITPIQSQPALASSPFAAPPADELSTSADADAQVRQREEDEERDKTAELLARRAETYSTTRDEASTAPIKDIGTGAVFGVPWESVTSNAPIVAALGVGAAAVVGVVMRASVYRGGGGPKIDPGGPPAESVVLDTPPPAGAINGGWFGKPPADSTERESSTVAEGISNLPNGTEAISSGGVLWRRSEGGVSESEDVLWRRKDLMSSGDARESQYTAPSPGESGADYWRVPLNELRGSAPPTQHITGVHDQSSRHEQAHVIDRTPAASVGRLRPGRRVPIRNGVLEPSVLDNAETASLKRGNRLD